MEGKEAKKTQEEECISKESKNETKDGNSSIPPVSELTQVQLKVAKTQADAIKKQFANKPVYYYPTNKDNDTNEEEDSQFDELKQDLYEEYKQYLPENMGKEANLFWLEPRNSKKHRPRYEMIRGIRLQEKLPSMGYHSQHERFYYMQLF